MMSHSAVSKQQVSKSSKIIYNPIPLLFLFQIIFLYIRWTDDKLRWRSYFPPPIFIIPFRNSFLQSTAEQVP